MAPLVLEAGQFRELNFQLKLGGISEEIRVSSQAQSLLPSLSDWGNSIEPEQIQDLPLNGRDLFDLAVLEPGAYIAVNAERTMSAPGLQVSANGARPNQNAFQLDGVPINGAGSGAPASATGDLLGLEMIQELRVVTTPFQASFGRSAGATLIAATKRGTNALHGSVYEFFRDSALDARNCSTIRVNPFLPCGGQLALSCDGFMKTDGFQREL